MKYMENTVAVYYHHLRGVSSFYQHGSSFSCVILWGFMIDIIPHDNVLNCIINAGMYLCANLQFCFHSISYTLNTNLLSVNLLVLSTIYFPNCL